LTSAEIETEALWLVAQCLNQLRRSVLVLRTVSASRHRSWNKSIFRGRKRHLPLYLTHHVLWRDLSTAPDVRYHT